MGLEQDLTATLRAAAEEHGVPGAAAGLVVGDELVVATHGVTNVDHPRPVGPSTMFQVGSISKTFTSAALMLLVEEGRLSLDDPIAHHLPGLAETVGLDLHLVTVEHALSHQAGFDGDHLFTQREPEDLTKLAGARRFFAPGAGYSYNNAGFSLAGAVVEVVTGQRFDAFVADRLLRPLGLVGAGYRADDVITHEVAAPHWVADGEGHVLRRAGWQPGWELGAVDHPAGGLVASVSHLLAWCRFQATGTAADGTRLLSATALARLHAPVVRADLLDQIGLDWFVRDLDGATSIGHGGVTVGYVSDLVVVPDREVAFVGLTNATNGAAVNQAVRRWALERVAGIVERDPQPDPAPSADHERFTGRYLHSFAVLDVAPGDASGTVVVTSSARTDLAAGAWQPPPEAPIICRSFAHDHVVSLDASGPARIGRFGLDGTGPAAWLQWGGRRAPRLAEPTGP